MGPDINAAEASSARTKTVEAKAEDRPVSDPVGDALLRLVPSLGAHGTTLRAPLLALQAQPNATTAWTALWQALDAIAPTLPEEHRADLDALRLQLAAASVGNPKDKKGDL
jgi:hypothetical protein